MLKSSLTAIVMMAVTVPALGRVDVVDSQPLNAPIASGYPTTQVHDSGPQKAVTPDNYSQIQAMQDEIQELRGLVEQQSNELKRLKQQREDDYLDIDRRLSALSKGGHTTSEQASDGALKPAPEDALDTHPSEKKTAKLDPKGGPKAGELVDTPAEHGSDLKKDPSKNDAALADKKSTAASETSQEEFSLYNSALNAILKNKDNEQGLAGMTKYLAKFPKGKFAPNAYFWQGSVYQSQNKTDKSIESFEKMVKRFPKEPKSIDARMRLAKLYLLRGDKEEARLMLEEVAEQNVPESKNAKDQLKRNF